MTSSVAPSDMKSVIMSEGASRRVAAWVRGKTALLRHSGRDVDALVYANAWVGSTLGQRRFMRGLSQAMRSEAMATVAGLIGVFGLLLLAGVGRLILDACIGNTAWAEVFFLPNVIFAGVAATFVVAGFGGLAKAHRSAYPAPSLFGPQLPWSGNPEYLAEAVLKRLGARDARDLLVLVRDPQHLQGLKRGEAEELMTRVNEMATDMRRSSGERMFVCKKAVPAKSVERFCMEAQVLVPFVEKPIV